MGQAVPSAPEVSSRCLERCPGLHAGDATSLPALRSTTGKHMAQTVLSALGPGPGALPEGVRCGPAGRLARGQGSGRGDGF